MTSEDHTTTAELHAPSRSLVIPVYLNAPNISPLVEAVTELSASLDNDLELVFVVDGSPDDSFARLTNALSGSRLTAQVICHSRNFGSFAAIRTGMEAARGVCVAVMAADLQEPIELIEEFFRILDEDRADLVVGTRTGRDDGMMRDAASRTYWRLARRIISSEIPHGGVDVFACNGLVREALLEMREQNSSLIGQLYWLGFRREEVSYQRLERTAGTSGWTLRRKINYLLDSFFSFTDLPIRALTMTGVIGLAVAFGLAVAVLLARVTGAIDVPGYAAIVLVVIGFSALNLFTIGVIGNYVYRTFENTKQRPLGIVSGRVEFSSGRSDRS